MNCTPSCQNHLVEYYQSTPYLISTLVEYIQHGLEKNEGILILAKSEHIRLLRCELAILEIKPKASQLMFLDGNEALKKIMLNRYPDGLAFKNFVNNSFKKLSDHKSIRVYSELVQILAEGNNVAASLELEKLWNVFLHEREDILLMCGYSSETEGVKTFRQEISDAHSLVMEEEQFSEHTSGMMAEITRLKLRLHLEKLKNANPETHTGLEEMVSQMAHSMKMHHLGELASSTAHEIANPLAIINGNTMIMTELLKENNSVDLNQFIKSINEASERINKILKNLSRATKKQSRFSGCSIQEAINCALNLLRPQFLSSGIEVSYDISDESLHSLISEEELIQILISLISNASDAINDARIKGTGRIQIVVKGLSSDELEISIQDNGGGIPDDVATKLFAPFYTTKRPGKGTGIGLPISRKLLRENSGDLSYRTVKGEGTIFSVRLPVAS